MYKLSETSNEIFSSLEKRSFLTGKQMKDLTYEFTKLLTLANYTYYLRSIKSFIMSLEDQ